MNRDISSQLPPERTAPDEDGSPATGRLVSVDALRGFDMFWIVGAIPIVQALEKMSPSGLTSFLKTQLEHVKWEGFHFIDLIFPLFLFIVGISTALSLGQVLAQGGRGKALARVARRSVLLFLLGWFYYGGFDYQSYWPGVLLLWGGVLQRIAICYFFAALVFLFFSPRIIAALCAVLLAGYCALMTFVPFPDVRLEPAEVQRLAMKAGSHSRAAIAAAAPGRIRGISEEGRNLANFLDFRLWPGPAPLSSKASAKAANRVYTEGGILYYMNEGFLTLLPSVAISLGGVLAGLLLRSARLEDRRKVAWLFAIGLVAVLIGFLWSFQFPMIKRIWTSSFCLTAAGYSAMLTALFFLVVDVWKRQGWCRPFVWIGMNPITIYLAASIVPFHKLARRLAGGRVQAFFDEHVAQGLGELLIGAVSLALVIWLAHFLYQQKIFLRV